MYACDLWQEQRGRASNVGQWGRSNEQLLHNHVRPGLGDSRVTVWRPFAYRFLLAFIKSASHVSSWRLISWRVPFRVSLSTLKRKHFAQQRSVDACRCSRSTWVACVFNSGFELSVIANFTTITWTAQFLAMWLSVCVPVSAKMFRRRFRKMGLVVLFVAIQAQFQAEVLFPQRRQLCFVLLECEGHGEDEEKEWAHNSAATRTRSKPHEFHVFALITPRGACHF